MKGFKQGHLIALRRLNWSGGRKLRLWWGNKTESSFRNLSDRGLNLDNGNETMETDTDTKIISEVGFSRREMKKEFSMILRFGLSVWAGEWYHYLR